MEKLRTYAQSLPITFESWIISFAGIILIRIFFEQFSSFNPKRFVIIDAPTIIHYGVYYIVTTVGLMIILMFFAKTSLKEVSAICILGSFVIWVAPIVDLISSGAGGHLMSYLFVPWQELLSRFITFFGGHITSGVTLGMQIETMLGIIFCYIYTYTVTKNVLRSVGAGITFFCFLFFTISMPSFVALFLPQQGAVITSIAQSITSSHIIQNNIHPNFTATNLALFDLAFNKLMTGVNTILAIIISGLLFFIGARKKFMALLKNSRPERIFHFFLLFIFGISLAHPNWPINLIDIQTYILAFVAFIFAWMFSVCQNDIYDETIDAISNKDRPFISKYLSKDDLQIASKIFLLFTFLSAYASNHYTIFFVSLFLFVYYIYSNPPLRLKRFVLLNSFLVSLACLAVIMAGFFIINNDKTIIAFPPILVLAIIIFFTAVSNIRDIKDIEGDRADGIKTIPVLLGAEKSKKIIAGIICFFFLLIPWYFNISSIIFPSIMATILSWYFITEKDYKEWKGFMVYMVYLIFIISAFLLK
ncbi:MAG: UbiA family prenyltransferase [bacterium]